MTGTDISLQEDGHTGLVQDLGVGIETEIGVGIRKGTGVETGIETGETKRGDIIQRVVVEPDPIPGAEIGPIPPGENPIPVPQVAALKDLPQEKGSILVPGARVLNPPDLIPEAEVGA